MIGQYVKVAVFRSRKARDFFFPKPDEANEVNTKPFYAAWNTIWDDYQKYIDDIGFADFIEMERKPSK